MTIRVKCVDCDAVNSLPNKSFLGGFKCKECDGDDYLELDGDTKQEPGEKTEMKEEPKQEVETEEEETELEHEEDEEYEQEEDDMEQKDLIGKLINVMKEEELNNLSVTYTRDNFSVTIQLENNEEE